MDQHSRMVELKLVTKHCQSSPTYSYHQQETPRREDIMDAHTSFSSDCSSVPSMVEDHESDVSTDDDYQYHMAGAELWNSFWKANALEETATATEAAVSTPQKSTQGYPAPLKTFKGPARGSMPPPARTSTPQRGAPNRPDFTRSRSADTQQVLALPQKYHQRAKPSQPASYSLYPPPSAGDSPPAKRPSMGLRSSARHDRPLPPIPPPPSFTLPLHVRPSRELSRHTTSTATAPYPPTAPLPPLPAQEPRKRPSLANLRKRSYSKMAGTSSAPQHQPRPPAQPEPVSVFELDDDSRGSDQSFARRLVRGLRGEALARNSQAAHRRSASETAPVVVGVAGGLVRRARAETVGTPTGSGREGVVRWRAGDGLGRMLGRWNW